MLKLMGKKIITIIVCSSVPALTLSSLVGTFVFANSLDPDQDQQHSSLSWSKPFDTDNYSVLERIF